MLGLVEKLAPFACVLAIAVAVAGGVSLGDRIARVEPAPTKVGPIKTFRATPRCIALPRMRAINVPSELREAEGYGPVLHAPAPRP